ncbi:UDP-4-amino-4,6-dideoxy-N-acetyl-beta-L-altrosamine N-acetyltransferase [Geomonas propionica]|uniref:UDP-4-amino-4, 6-dideoxy-N-acetyl-beta-L-altrosamine N-acetyltransferase n=1 Tax=Geomonas propionica TaxID=2798582 RepID=A0ABS0YUQ4_9BACT|nr:UDP-4-amino-4,6-dideoxy-N-acetyl-beta-L-altrosamine N-acetyltransferase [Geomonas propionica]MBJ6801705.1 UDP-4-amino-4,6-dideoxy-N-acetyl-beta-L-altrosamine N-acetyltransferase [Geomonas propionica]
MIQRKNCLLRRIEERDLEMVLRWRNSDRIRHNMYTDHVITLQEHKAWFEKTKQTDGALHLVFELENRPIGLVYYVGIDRHNGRAEWGFYLGVEDAPRGSGSALGVLGVEFAFMELKLRKLCGEVLGYNEASLRFHRKLGFCEEGRLVRHVEKHGEYHDVVLFALFEEDWQKNRKALEELAFHE